MAQTQKAHIRDLVIVLSKILLQNRGKLERSLISVLNRIQEKQEGPEALPPSEPIPDPPPAPKPELDNQKPDTTGGIHMDKKPIRNPNLDKPLPAPSFELPEEEKFTEFYDVPQPDELIYISGYESGRVFRSGCAYHRGRGKVFYFQPGHESFPIYRDANIQKVIRNAVYWVAPNKD